MTTIATTYGEAFEILRGAVAGDVHTSADAGYAEAIATFNVTVRHRPALVVEARCAEDVVQAVRFARAHDLPVAVQATGHGGQAADGALLINTRRMRGVTVDPVERTARVEAGAPWKAVLDPAQQHGLAPLMGSSSGVGAVGYTLGGGMGWLARRYGLASDSVRSFDLVVPDGTRLTASATENAEVFWALRGGGTGILGVVVAMEIELYPVSTVYAGTMLYPAWMAREVMRHWRNWVETVGDELTSAVGIMNFPPLEIVPEPLRGKSFVTVRGCWSGDLEAGHELMDSWRAWWPPTIDLFGPLPFTEADAISNDPKEPMPVLVSTEWFDQLPDEAIDVLVTATLPEPGFSPVLTMTEIRHAGGAIRRGAAAAANDRGRSGEFLLELLAVPPYPDATPAVASHLHATRVELEPYVSGASYLNFLEGGERRDRSVDAFSPEHLRRLRAVKNALDPQGRFGHGIGVRGE